MPTIINKYKTLFFHRHKLLFLLVISLTSCSPKSELQLQLELPITINCPGKIESQITRNDSKKFQLLSEWLKASDASWEATSASYVPKTIISNNEISFNFLDDIVVVNRGQEQFVQTLKTPNLLSELCKS